jgi:choice-of-anchor B domain-containing protein
MKNLHLSFFFVVALMAITTVAFAQQDYNVHLRSTLEYPGQTLANICGYTQDGREYALLGASQGLIIVDVTDPDAPVNIQQISGPNNLWKEIKVYGHYAYVTSEGGQGVQIVDLTSLPTPSTVFHNYKGDGAISGTLNTIHALHIDVKKGFLYLYGSNLFNGGAVICDLNQDPYNPVYVGNYSTNGYVHDGYADNDTLYAAHINAGFLSIVDMSNKQNPVVLGTVITPGKFTHNAWILSDRKTILTTDEDFPSFITSYDVSDPGDIRELDRSSTGDGNNAIGHNTHVLNDWAINSYYIDGFNIVDVHRPDNLVEVGRYDTWASSGEFDGCWGVYPFLPSGTIVASNIPNTNGGTGKLFVCSPTYVRACYLEGSIINGCNGQPLADATITLNGTPVNTTARSKNTGVFKTGFATPGTYTVTVSKLGYLDQTVTVTLATAQVTPLTVTLTVDNPITITGALKNANNQLIIPNTNFILSGNGQELNLQTNAQGKFNLTCFAAGTYKIGAWGYYGTTVDISASGQLDIALQPGYYDDFELDLGWTNSSTAATGDWELGVPIGTNFNNALVSPDADASGDNNDQCYITDNGGGQAGAHDVDNGEVVLSTPAMKLAGLQDATLSFDYWFVNTGGQGGNGPNDNFTVKVTNGTETATVLTTMVSESAWRSSGDISLKNLITLNNNVKVLFSAIDIAPGHLVEAGVDIFKVTPIATAVQNPIDVNASIVAAPNPSAAGFTLRYDWPGTEKAIFEVRNVLGQVVLQQTVSGSGTYHCGTNWTSGVYFATLRTEKAQSQVLKLNKI